MKCKWCGAEVISIHAPLTGSDKEVDFDNPRILISIHAPLTGSDDCNGSPSIAIASISIHAPLTGSDAVVSNADWRSCISIHAPLTGSDGDQRPAHIVRRDFNPRSPHRERHSPLLSLYVFSHFNPRSPHRERLYCLLGAKADTAISIHAPLTGSDPYAA